ncbi:hypothetical protein KL930_002466 [Ogataea haglerorum]|uniref:FACT complex subunit POB3 n=1 Tax=Ogataea haglerorum TaxID=1937702 RepID=A0AAN6D7R6_9ASCO|nr:uncharacterized protein KL911_002231 [Ogataea haglerorum]KAG7697084.1 hypothetical protein KL915_002347 [Ogataea haglerorum]KAG7697228.1 hypothetical protein KL951_002590 [Ogataea haglerorum]KAG7707754.1 hypothetical protein KL914_002575 [Ogataea haglerorum]KAG7709791.1 hypothetical protein KL950_002010 [Ogataea haglerorum]KAG7719870.1 hypothetical protein KL913_001839 [Ogataea haglerorum]
MSTEYEKIYLNQSKQAGRMRIADSGLGWKAQTAPGSTVKSTPFLLPSDEISSAHWSRGSRGWELRIDTKNKGVVMLDGFDQQDLNGLKNELQRNFGIQLEVREHSLRGWNWGKTQLTRNELIFNVNNRPAFEIPYSDITNSNLSRKNEVTVEMNLGEKHEPERTGDELVEMKLYIPGTLSEDEEEGEEGETNEASEPRSLAQVFSDQLREKADVGQVTGEAIVSFEEILFLTPRGRYDVDMYDTFMRLRGKTYDYKLQYSQIQRIFSLPKLYQLNHLIVLQVDPPLRQGQTRYSFLTIQVSSEEEIEVELNLDDEEYESKYKERLNKTYNNNTYMVMTSILKGFTERRVVVPGNFMSKDSQVAISCSLKANEGQLYPLEKCLLFVTKPTVLIPYSEITNIVFSRIGSGTGASRTFDMEVNLRNGARSHSFGNMDRGEQTLLENFFKSKNLKVRNDEKVAQEMLASAMAESDGDSDMDMGSADDDESPDEDFNDEDMSGSDVAEEYDSDASVSDDGDDDEPQKKKPKKE